MNSSIAILSAGMSKSRPVRVPAYRAPVQRIKVEPTTIRVSDHAYNRIKERIGIKGKAARKRVEDAWWKGMMGHEATGELAIWLTRKQSKNPDVTSIRVLNGFAFLFAGTVCLTVLEIHCEEP